MNYDVNEVEIKDLRSELEDLIGNSATGGNADLSDYAEKDKIVNFDNIKDKATKPTVSDFTDKNDIFRVNDKLYFKDDNDNIIEVGSSGGNDDAEKWKANTGYSKDDLFSFKTTLTTATFKDGTKIEPNKIYIAHYDANTTSSGSLTKAEIAKMLPVSGSSSGGSLYAVNTYQDAENNKSTYKTNSLIYVLEWGGFLRKHEDGNVYPFGGHSYQGAKKAITYNNATNIALNNKSGTFIAMFTTNISITNLDIGDDIDTGTEFILDFYNKNNNNDLQVNLLNDRVYTTNNELIASVTVPKHERVIYVLTSNKGKLLYIRKLWMDDVRFTTIKRKLDIVPEDIKRTDLVFVERSGGFKIRNESGDVETFGGQCYQNSTDPLLMDNLQEVDLIYDGAKHLRWVNRDRTSVVIKPYAGLKPGATFLIDLDNKVNNTGKDVNITFAQGIFTNNGEPMPLTVLKDGERKIYEAVVDAENNVIIKEFWGSGSTASYQNKNKIDVLPMPDTITFSDLHTAYNAVYNGEKTTVINKEADMQVGTDCLLIVTASGIAQNSTDSKKVTLDFTGNLFVDSVGGTIQKIDVYYPDVAVFKLTVRDDNRMIVEKLRDDPFVAHDVLDNPPSGSTLKPDTYYRFNTSDGNSLNYTLPDPSTAKGSIIVMHLVAAKSGAGVHYDSYEQGSSNNSRLIGAGDRVVLFSTGTAWLTISKMGESFFANITTTDHTINYGNDKFLMAMTTGSDITITIPDTAGAIPVTIKNVSTNDNNTITVVTANGATIDGASSLGIKAGESYTIFMTASGVKILSSHTKSARRREIICDKKNSGTDVTIPTWANYIEFTGIDRRAEKVLTGRRLTLTISVADLELFTSWGMLIRMLPNPSSNNYVEYRFEVKYDKNTRKLYVREYHANVYNTYGAYTVIAYEK